MEQQRSHFSEEREDEQEATFEGTTIRLEQEKRLAETLEDVQRSMQKLSEHLEGAAEQKAAEPDLQAPPSAFVPELSRTERSEVARRGSPKALIVLETIREEGENELARAPAALAVSGLAVGLSMDFSVL